MKKMKYKEAEELLESYGVNTVKSSHVDKAEQAVNKAREIGLPVVMKVDSPDVIHKSDRGYVKTNLDTEKEVKKAFNQMKKQAESEDAEFHGAVIQKQLKGKEVIIGGKRDPQFGPVVLFGLGGIFVEIFEDTSLRVAPIDKEEARKMMKEIKAYPLLTGVRGEEPVAIKELTNTLHQVSKLMKENPDIREMDLNPTIVNPKNAYAVDLRILKEEQDD